MHRPQRRGGEEEDPTKRACAGSEEAHSPYQTLTHLYARVSEPALLPRSLDRSLLRIREMRNTEPCDEFLRHVYYEVPVFYNLDLDDDDDDDLYVAKCRLVYYSLMEACRFETARLLGLKLISRIRCLYF